MSFYRQIRQLDLKPSGRCEVEYIHRDKTSALAIGHQVRAGRDAIDGGSRCKHQETM